MVQEDCQPKCTNTVNAGAELMERWRFHHTVAQLYMNINSFPQNEDKMHQNKLRAPDSHSNTDLRCTTTAVHSFGSLSLSAVHSFGFLKGW